MSTPADFLTRRRAVIEQALEFYLPPAADRPEKLHEAMRYSVLAGGKRLRPIFCLAVAEALGVTGEGIVRPALALEVLHTYTLIHDDLPAMDDDALRRGKPTNHVVFGEATAILAGDALLTLAFEWLSQGPVRERYTPADLVRELAVATGSYGVIAGQMADMAAEHAKPTAELIEYIHAHKTADLLRAAVRIGAMLGNADEEQLERLSLYGQRVGLAFQLMDDVLNVVADAKVLGKATGSDTDHGKATAVSLWGVEETKVRAQNYVAEALSMLQAADLGTPELIALAQYSVSRNK